MLVFDVTDRLSFENISMWQSEFFEYADIADDKPFPFVLVGNKGDLADQRQVSNEEAQTWAKEHGNIAYLEASAKTSVNVENAFIEIARQLQVREEPTARFTDTVDLSAHKSKGCC